jgi:hypothetical protein
MAQQPEFTVKLIVNGRSTSDRISANDAGAAARLAREKYAGSSVRVLETNKVKN